MVEFANTERKFDLKGIQVVTNVNPDHSDASTAGQRVYNEEHQVTQPRTHEITETFNNVPVVKEVEVIVPKVTVAEITRTIPVERIEYLDQTTEIPQKRIIDRYVEVPQIVGPPIEKFVPQIEVIERKIEAKQHVTKWKESIVEVPRIHEVVRYVERGSEVEEVIRYVPSGPLPAEYFQDEGRADYLNEVLERQQLDKRMTKFMEAQTTQSEETLNSLKSTTTPLVKGESSVSHDFVEVVKVEGEALLESGDEPEIHIPVPYLVPKVNIVEIETPVIKFVDHFVPIPIRRHVIPRISFNDETYQVDCIHEKPVLVVQDFHKPVPVNVKISVREGNVDVVPIDPNELSQGDVSAMWMRCNADLLDLYQLKHQGLCPYGFNPEVPDIPRMPASKDEQKLLDQEEARDGPPEEETNSIPLYPGHPGMLAVLQNLYLNKDTTGQPQIYGPDFQEAYSAALDAAQNPQPHCPALSAAQVHNIGPLPAQALPQPWQYIPTKDAKRIGGLDLTGIAADDMDAVYDTLNADTQVSGCC